MSALLYGLCICILPSFIYLLGGAKISNPANTIFSSCAAETLNTLKFAQRAKLIQNNVSMILYLMELSHIWLHCEIIYFFTLFMMKAVVNEDSSGDVIALQHQIRLLKVFFSSFSDNMLLKNKFYMNSWV